MIEIGCVEMINRQPTGNDLHLYVNPQRAIDAGAQAVHGITAEFLADKPVFADVAQRLVDFIQGADEVIIHNASFDTGFLDQELRLVQRPAFASHVGCVVDSLALAKSLYPAKRNSLDALCERLEVNNTHRTLHGALLDARLLAEVYIRLTRGQESLIVEHAAEDDAVAHIQRHDYSQMVLPVLRASDAECAAHAAMLEVIDQASKGKTLWRTTPSFAEKPSDA